jgi:hypothetical protein
MYGTCGSSGRAGVQWAGTDTDTLRFQGTIHPTSNYKDSAVIALALNQDFQSAWIYTDRNYDLTLIRSFVVFVCPGYQREPRAARDAAQ